MIKLIQKEGIGVDIINVQRFYRTKIEKNRKFYKKIFLESEINYCLKFKSPYEHFAGKFALKEAVIKSIPEKISFLEIHTLNSKNGPMVKLLGKNAKKYSFLCSISHENDFAIAFVISTKKKS